MSYNNFPKYNYKPVKGLRPYKRPMARSSAGIIGILKSLLPGSAARRQSGAVSVVYYDYTPKHGFVAAENPPYRSKLIATSVVLMGISLGWSLDQSSAFYEPLEQSSARLGQSIADKWSVLSNAISLNDSVDDAGLSVDDEAEQPTETTQISPIDTTQDFDLALFSSESPRWLPLNPLATTPAVSFPPLGSGISSTSLGMGDFESLLRPDAPQPPVATVTTDPVPAPKPHNENDWLEVAVVAKDSLSSIFERNSLSHKELLQILALREHRSSLRNLSVGQKIRIRHTADGKIIALTLKPSPEKELYVFRSEESKQGFSAKLQELPTETRVVHAGGKITNSLYSDGRKAGLSGPQVSELMTMFGWDIDFALDLSRGDSFAVVYEEQWLEGKRLRAGNILAAEFVLNGEPHRAVYYRDPKGKTEYYTPTGESLEKAFIRTPVKVGVITSGFSAGRLHPVLNTIRAHKGVDYSAPTGTPIYATGNGKVDFKGRKGGYGNTIVLQHGDRYSTLYGHLSAFADGIKEGERVRQGDLIGYVGSSGLATGPHLHYEFLVDGEHANPLTVKLPNSLPLPAEYKKDFERKTRVALAQLAQASALALNQKTKTTP